MVPVCGGGSFLKVDGSTCGRAGRRFFLMIFLTFFPSSLMYVVTASSAFVIVKVVEGSFADGGDSERDGEGTSFS